MHVEKRWALSGQLEYAARKVPGFEASQRLFLGRPLISVRATYLQALQRDLQQRSEAADASGEVSAAGANGAPSAGAAQQSTELAHVRQASGASGTDAPSADASARASADAGAPAGRNAQFGSGSQHYSPRQWQAAQRAHMYAEEARASSGEQDGLSRSDLPGSGQQPEGRG